MNDVRKHIENYIRERLPEMPSENIDGFNYIAGGMDSLAVIELIISLEKELQISFDDEDFENDEFQTVGGLIAASKAKKAHAQ